MIETSRRSFVLGGTAAKLAIYSADQPQFDLAIGISSQSYCKGDEEVGFIRIVLDCTVLNKTSAVLVVAREPDPPHELRLAATLEDHKSGKFIHQFTTSWYHASNSSEGTGTTALAPGDSHTWSTRIQIPVTIPIGRGRSLKPGKYWLSVVIDTQPRAASASDVRRPHIVLSRPVSVVVEAEPVFRSCY